MRFTDAHRHNLSVAHMGHKRTPEAIEKTASFHRGRTRSKETCEKISKANSGTNHPMYGKKHSEATKLKMAATRKGRAFTEEHKLRISESMMGKTHSDEHNRKVSAARQGISLDDWNGYVSFEPYCPRFNNQLKERIRNRDGITCGLCGTGEIQNGQRLSVHHIDGDKMQGCVGQRWYLCALCISCNSRPDTVEKEFLIVSNLHHLEMMK